jgi:hypothetical protein
MVAYHENNKKVRTLERYNHMLSRRRDQRRRNHGATVEFGSEGMCSAGDAVPEVPECRIFVGVFACVCLLGRLWCI